MLSRLTDGLGQNLCDPLLHLLDFVDHRCELWVFQMNIAGHSGAVGSALEGMDGLIELEPEAQAYDGSTVLRCTSPELRLLSALGRRCVSILK